MELITRERGSGVVVAFPQQVQLEGEQSRLFKDRIREVIDGRSSWVVIDLAKVDFIDSSGLGALISALKVLRSNGGDLVLSSMSEQVRSVFEITRLLRVFEVHEDPNSALSKVERPRTALATTGRE